MAIRRREVLAGLFATGSLATWGLTSKAAHAYDVTITPTAPQLGDTISVIVQARDSATPAPTVMAKGKAYASFPLSNNRFRAFIPTSPLDSPGSMTIQVNGAEETRNLTVGLRNRSFPTQRITLRGSGSLGTDHEFDRVDAFKQLVSPERHWNGPLLRPSEGRVSSEYGVRRYYNGEFAEDYYHRGVDYAAGTGTPVVAPAAGYIRLVGRVSDGFELHGNTVGIDHGQGLLSIMIHLSRIDVNEGDFVRAGQRVGAIGSTGAATGPHLHWGLYINEVAVDPVPWRYGGFE
ncbi:M23 family metallopeptidase [Leptothoe sp. PORK10 BA2]|uniref:M23 family metallopeptidase n=1 Tax=Leptothoe sp. PORK10 BA2 TaxID=3110254 RepID=UPI002B215AFB|nr:M23 family metallopeptidase [Leptothoe sp. PORK10 BA2]MEA5466533.1 M23 family metallopeptidase [Leptothoe sp. PORK10 BA2]